MGDGRDRRGDWIGELDFEVPVVDGKIEPDVEYLFWVGCAGALEDRARKTTKAIASLLHTAGVKFAVLGPAETCTGDPARRDRQRVRVLDAGRPEHRDAERGARRRRSWPPARTASTPSRTSTRSSAANYEVIHHTQLLARLVAEGKLKPAGRVDEKLTYHDPCFLGRHNKVYTPPREILEAVPGVQATEMHRCK